ncbi:MAG: endonuclease/exonuclease/phosphatase family protein [Methylocystaceae bacterium]
MELTIVTFNLKSATSRKSKHPWYDRLGAVKLFMEKYKPDVIGTQELTITAINDLMRLLPDYRWIGLGRGGGHCGEFSAVIYNASKLICRAQDTFWLGKRPAVEGSRIWHAAYPRVCTWGIFREVNGNANLAVYNTHLDHFSPWARLSGLKQIGRFIRKMNTGYPTILMGDFNARPNSMALRALRTINTRHHLFGRQNFKTFLSGDDTIGRTYHRFTGSIIGKPIDYIFTSPDITVKKVKVDHNRYDNRYPSDHFPIVMRVNTEEMQGQ